MPSITYGNQNVPLHQRPHWQPVPHCPYRRLKVLTPSSRWFDLPPANAETLWETHVAQALGTPIPPAALAAQEWINAGARSAYVEHAGMTIEQELYRSLCADAQPHNQP